MHHFFSNRSLKLRLMFSSNFKYRNGLRTVVMVKVDTESIPIQKLALFSAQICVNVFPVIATPKKRRTWAMWYKQSTLKQS